MRLIKNSNLILFNRKLSLGLANSEVIHSFDKCPKPIDKCPKCSGNLEKRFFWFWTRKGYDDEDCNLDSDLSHSVRSTLMHGTLSNRCQECGFIFKTKDKTTGIEKFNKIKAYLPLLFNKNL